MLIKEYENYRQYQSDKLHGRILTPDGALSDAEMDAELEKGYADMKEGRTKSAKSVFSDIRKDYGL